jgi:hypothetical protein
MGRRSEEYRAEARRLAEHAETASDENARLMLGSAARRLREIADEVERDVKEQDNLVKDTDS